MIEKTPQKALDQARELLVESSRFYEMSNFAESERLTKEALSMLEEHSDVRDTDERLSKQSISFQLCDRTAWAYNRLMTIALVHADYTLAFSHAEKALHFAERIQDFGRIASLLGNIASVYYYLQEFNTSLSYYQRALALAKEVGNKKSIATLLGSIAHSYQGLNEFAVASEYYQQSLALSEELHDTKLIANIFLNRGVLHYKLAEYEAAIENFSRALAMEEETNEDASTAAASLGLLGATYATTSFAGFNAAKAEDYCLRAIAIAEEHGFQGKLMEFQRTLADLYEAEQRHAEALLIFKRFYENEKSVLSDESRKTAHLFDIKRQSAEREQQEQLERTRALAEKRILNNVLPELITERLIKGEKPIAEHFDSVSILFLDIVDFTSLTSRISAHQLIHLLNAIFSAADEVMQRFGLEKIKTIGDAYMAVAGAPIIQSDHAIRATHAALRLLEVMQSLVVQIPEEADTKSEVDALPEIQVRIGLHCGSAVAGVVGEHKFLYDLWGDAVNTASRMESNGLPGKVHASAAFVEQVLLLDSHTEDSIRFIERGEMEIKGKGLMRTYFLEKK